MEHFLLAKGQMSRVRFQEGKVVNVDVFSIYEEGDFFSGHHQAGESEEMLSVASEQKGSLGEEKQKLSPLQGASLLLLESHYEEQKTSTCSEPPLT